MAVNTNISIPQSPFLDTTTGRPAREWLVWLQYPQVVSINLANALSVASGGTGSQAIPANGQTLIGNGSVYKTANLTPDIGIGITNGPGTITIKNTGVTSFSAGSTGLTPTKQTNGDVVLAGTLQVANGGTGIISVPTGNLVFGNSTSQLAYDTDLYWSSSLKDLQVVTAAINSKRSFTAISGSAGMSIGVDASNNGFLYSLTTQVFYANGFEKMRIDINGNVGIGTINPYQYGKLTVFGGNATSVFSLSTGQTNFKAVADVAANSTKVGYGFWSTFGSGTDYLPRRSADIFSSFNGGTWGTEYLSFGVGYNGANNDAANPTIEKMRINANGAVSFGNTGTNYGSNGQLLMSGGNASPIWQQSLYFDTGTTTLQNVTLSSGTYQSFAVVNLGALTAMGVDAYNNSFINAQNDLFIGTNTTARLRITSGGAFYWNGTLGASGTFVATGKTVTVSYGIITSIV
jgi:hypothetical protein